MLGQRPSSEEVGHNQSGMSPLAFFYHYPALQPFLLGELRGAAQDLQGPSNEAKLHLQPSLFPVLTLLAQLQPGVQDTTEWILFTYHWAFWSSQLLYFCIAVVFIHVGFYSNLMADQYVQ